MIPPADLSIPPAPSFLQSPEWEEIQKKSGRKTARIRSLLVVRHDTRVRFNYLYIPRPFFESDLDLKTFFEEVGKFASSNRSIFLKVDPLRPVAAPQNKGRGIVASFPFQPRLTSFLDLRKSEEELLEEMHDKTRYSVRVSQKHALYATADSSSGGEDIFWKLLCDTVERQGFRPHTRDYYKNLVSIKTTQFSNELFFVYHNGRALASAMVNFFTPSSAATYIHGASADTEKEVMAPHFLQMFIIREAKRRGFLWYDLGGLDEKKLPGVSRFKKRFGGISFEYPPSIDIVYRPLAYRFYKLAKGLW